MSQQTAQTSKAEVGGQMVLADAFYKLGEFLVDDDIMDFPWTNIGTRSHPGMFHHGSIGMVMQLFGLGWGHAIVAGDMAQEFVKKDVFQETIETWERIAYPSPGL